MPIDLGDIPSGSSPSPAEKLQIRSAIGVGTTDAPTFAGVTMASSTSLLSHSAGAGVYDSRVNLKLLVDNAAFSNNLSFRYAGGSMVQVWAGQTPAGVASFGSEGFNVVNKLGFSTVATNAPIVVLEQDAPGILAQRNGTAKQALRVYNTALSGAPEWAEFDWITSGVGNTLRIGTNLSGTGAARPIEFVTGGVVRMSIAAGGNVGIGIAAPVSILDIRGANGVASAVQIGSLATNIGNFISLHGSATNGAAVRIFSNYWVTEGGLHLGTYSNQSTLCIATGGKVGIGTASPASSLQVKDGDVEVETVTNGIILKAAGTSTRYRLTLNAGGTALVFTAV